VTLRWSANLSTLHADLPLLERPAVAAAEGFAYVETWWPFERPVPPPGDVDAFCAALDAAGVRLVSLNLDAGDPHAGERGLLSIPSHGARVEDNLEAALDILRRTGCRVVNALYGNREAAYDPGDQDRTALRRLVRVADRVAPLDAVVVVETLNRRDSPAFPLVDIEVTADVVRRANAASAHGNVGLLLDTYHLATMGTDPVAAMHRYASLVQHVQFADAPGRGRPGTGSVDFAAAEQALVDIGYDGYVGLEYLPDAGPVTKEATP
jgi:hydroxypyruvate isomerase